MKEVTRTLVVGRTISIDTKENDRVDIRCGGPPLLGFDFTIDADEDVKEITSFIKETFSEFKKSYIRLSVSSSTCEVSRSSIWSRDKIKKCIKDYSE